MKGNKPAGSKDTAIVNFTETWLPVNDLEVDPRVQRERHDAKKVERIVRNFNSSALGVISVSRRNQVTQIIIDGWHRWEAVRRLTDNTGEILCHVFEGLTIGEEAQMFLDLNAGNQPTVMDKFRARLLTGDPTALAVDQLAKHYGWKIQHKPENGTIQAVITLERIHLKTVGQDEVNPSILQLVLLVISKAWGQDYRGAAAMILEGLAAVLAEYGDKLEMDRLIQKLSAYPGGPVTLTADARQIGSMRRRRTPMVVAELIVDAYNSDLPARSSRGLQPWRRSR